MNLLTKLGTRLNAHPFAVAMLHFTASTAWLFQALVAESLNSWWLFILAIVMAVIFALLGFAYSEMYLATLPDK